MAKRTPSTQAQAAKMIRLALARNWPNTTFKVKSHSFAGGNAVDINWTDGPTWREVEAFAGRFEYGSFDGMQDLYEYTNVREDIPQVKYVQTHRELSREAFTAAVAKMNQLYRVNAEVDQDSRWNGVIDDYVAQAELGCRVSEYIHRNTHELSLVCGSCRAATLPGDAFCPDCGANLADAAALSAVDTILAAAR